ncbi:LexA family transcriptional regulator [Oscillibacter valericigenes]|nr:LexA family transcriptional regulator [Oscillibacter valericigenes]
MTEFIPILTGSRIKQVREERGLTLDDIARSVGVARSTVQRYEAGTIKRPKLPVIDAIAKFLNVNPSWLLNKENERGTYSNVLPSNAIPYTAPVRSAPILGRIPAGCPLLATNDILGYSPIDFPDTENYFWLSVSGDSMINAGINTGDLVLIRKQSCADDGQIVAARVNGDEATLKRFRRSGDTVMLVPENPQYAPIPVPASAFETDDAAIIGVVVELKRKFI